MKRETLLWSLVLLFGVALVVVRVLFIQPDMGKAYVKEDQKRFVNIGSVEDPDWVDYDGPKMLDLEIAETEFEALPEDQTISWVEYENVAPTQYYAAEANDPNQSEYQFSLPRTAGVWVAAFFTLAIFSFLFRDNPFYKISESVVVGVSAGYWMVVSFWDIMVLNLGAGLLPSVMKNWALPGLTGDALNPNYWLLIPFVLGVMLLMRLAPAGTWLARWPLAFIVGTTAGLRLVSFIHADFLSQIRNSIIPLWVEGPNGFDTADTIKNVILVIGVFACLMYFFFSFEHKGIVGHTARLGIWFLMITFGAAFGYTVMGRIALLAIRMEFLFDDWLWLIDPTGKRTAAVAEVVTTIGTSLGLM